MRVLRADLRQVNYFKFQFSFPQNKDTKNAYLVALQLLLNKVMACDYNAYLLLLLFIWPISYIL